MDHLKENYERLIDQELTDLDNMLKMSIILTLQLT